MIFRWGLDINALPTYFNWDYYEPNNYGSLWGYMHGGENCVELRASSGKWNDLNCNESLPFVCQTSYKCSNLMCLIVEDTDNSFVSLHT